MTDTNAETTEVHTRLLKCALEVDAARAYWTRTDGTGERSAQEAFDAYWFGARSLPRTNVLMTNLRARYDAFPAALGVLHRWQGMSADTRRAICHWHLQLADPLYRAFTGDFLVERRDMDRPVTRDIVTRWVSSVAEGRWTTSTLVQFASKLLSAAYAAQLVATTRDPRPLRLPRIPDDALAYLLHLLREVTFAGTVLDNPYLRSVGLDGATLEDRLRSLPDVTYRRQSDLVDLTWRYPSLDAWATATVTPEPLHEAPSW